MTLITFQDIYQWKDNNLSYQDEDLQIHVYDLLDTINEEILRKNKELMKDRYKNNYQYKKKGNILIVKQTTQLIIKKVIGVKRRKLV